tara:strand:- start:1225 stop:1395 length:171 start_codon:yes stop_codon:yes gene_type:complete
MELELKDNDDDRIRFKEVEKFMIIAIHSRTVPVVRLNKEQTEELILYLINNLDKLD